MKMKRAAAIATVSLVPALAAPASAQIYPAGPAVSPSGDDVVYLTDGGMLRGTLLEILPNDHATLQLANGQTATIEWSHIARIEQRGRPATPPQPAPAPAPAPVPAGTAFVHIESERPVQLESVARGQKAGWVTVCSSPCDRDVDLGSDYHITGSGVRASRPFQIEARPGGRVVIEVDPASKAGFVGGILMTSLMPIVSIVGIVVWAVGSVESNGSGGTNTAGAALTFGGLVGLTIGIVMIATNSSSKQTQSPMPVAPPGSAAAAAFQTPALFRF
jgi:hypothetical protein